MEKSASRRSAATPSPPFFPAPCHLKQFNFSRTQVKCRYSLEHFAFETLCVSKASFRQKTRFLSESAPRGQWPAAGGSIYSPPSILTFSMSKCSRVYRHLTCVREKLNCFKWQGAGKKGGEGVAVLRRDALFSMQRSQLGQGSFAAAG